jgi:type IV pilus assembly protein PilP
MRHLNTQAVVLLFALGVGAAVAHAAQASGQAPSAPAASAPPPAASPAPGAQPAPPSPAPGQPGATVPENYTYQPEGRRDPFLNLLGTGVQTNVTQRGEGAAGLLVGEISVRGVLQSRGALVAMVQGPDNRTYVIHQGDKLADGVVKSVTRDGLVIVQEVNDPLSIVKQREVRKLLRSLEDAKERL